MTQGAAELARAIVARELTAHAAIQAALDRIDEVNGTLNAVTLTLADEALAAADTADALLAGDGAPPPFLERRGERRDARLLLARPQRPGAAAARSHAPRLQDPERRDHLDVGVRTRARAVLRLALGPLTGFSMIATMAVPVVIVVYMIVSVGCIVHDTRGPRSEFNPPLHLVLPVAGMVLFLFPLYYQFYKAPPTYPMKAANWVAIGWAVIGIALTAWLAMRRPERVADMERVYVEDEPEAPPARTEMEMV